MPVSTRVRPWRRYRFPIAACLLFAMLPAFASSPGMADATPGVANERSKSRATVPSAMPPAPAPAPTTDMPVPHLCRRPSDAPMIAAYVRSNRAELRTTVRLWLQYTEDGSIVSMRLDPGSLDRTLDAAVLEWAKGLTICPGLAGSGYLGLTFDAAP